MAWNSEHPRAGQPSRRTFQNCVECPWTQSWEHSLLQQKNKKCSIHDGALVPNFGTSVFLWKVVCGFMFTGCARFSHLQRDRAYILDRFCIGRRPFIWPGASKPELSWFQELSTCLPPILTSRTSQQDLHDVCSETSRPHTCLFIHKWNRKLAKMVWFCWKFKVHSPGSPINVWNDSRLSKRRHEHVNSRSNLFSFFCYR